jgi:hypothetical protein
MAREESLLHPAQFPGGVKTMASKQTMADHEAGSNLPKARAGYKGKHRAPLEVPPLSEWGNRAK